MKRLLHKSLAILMALVVMTTTMSFTIDMHYCGDTLIDFSFIQQAQRCGMQKILQEGACENSIVSKKSCCSDKRLIIEGQDDLKQDFSTVTFEQLTFITSFAFSYILLFEGTTSSEVPLPEYSPPHVKQEVQVLYQTFLI